MGVKQSILAQMLHDLKLDPTHAHTALDMNKDGIMKGPAEEVEVVPEVVAEPVVEEKPKSPKVEAKAAAKKADVVESSPTTASEVKAVPVVDAVTQTVTETKVEEKLAASSDKDKAKKS